MFPPGVKVPQSEQPGPPSPAVQPPQTIGAQRPPSTTQPQQGHTPRTTGPSAFPGSLSDLVVSFENVKQKGESWITNLVKRFLNKSTLAWPQQLCG